MFSQARVGFFTVSVRMIAAATLALGVAYPLAVTGVSQLLMSSQANGSLIKDADGTVRGSSLLAQAFVDADGNALPQYFQPRPSSSGWDAMNSGGSNLGPNSSVLEQLVKERLILVESSNPDAQGVVPADSLTASASGLDPHVSWDNIEFQLARVAQARGLAESEVRTVARENTVRQSSDTLVNVTRLNFDLDQMSVSR